MEMAHQANSQKWHLELTSVWRAKCKEFRRKIKESGVNGDGARGEFAEMALRIDVSMESKL